MIIIIRYLLIFPKFIKMSTNLHVLPWTVKCWIMLKHSVYSMSRTGRNRRGSRHSCICKYYMASLTVEVETRLLKAWFIITEHCKRLLYRRWITFMNVSVFFFSDVVNPLMVSLLWLYTLVQVAQWQIFNIFLRGRGSEKLYDF